jgi:hypothetical protein
MRQLIFITAILTVVVAEAQAKIITNSVAATAIAAKESASNDGGARAQAADNHAQSGMRARAIELPAK